MAIRIYRLTSSNNATNVGIAATTIVQKGTIVQVNALQTGQPGAGNGVLSTELAINNSSNGNSSISSLQSTDNLLCRTVNSYATSLASVVCAFVTPMKRPVSPGDVLCINLIGTGTAPGSTFTGYDVFVQE